MDVTAIQRSGKPCHRAEVVHESVAGRQNLMQLHMCRAYEIEDQDGRPLLYPQVQVRMATCGSPSRIASLLSALIRLTPCRSCRH